MRLPESLQRRVLIGADRDPSHLVFSAAISVGCGSFGWGPASVLINRRSQSAHRAQLGTDHCCDWVCLPLRNPPAASG
jgi:hypothetical protein